MSLELKGQWVLPNRYTYIKATAAITLGDVLPISSEGSLLAGAMSGATTATATQRRTASVGVALNSAAAGERVKLQYQGLCQANVKSSAGNPIAAGQPLCFGSVKILEADPPTVATNHWCARAVGTVAAAATTSTVGVLRTVLMLGCPGLAQEGSGA